MHMHVFLGFESRKREKAERGALNQGHTFASETTGAVRGALATVILVLLLSLFPAPQSGGTAQEHMHVHGATRRFKTTPLFLENSAFRECVGALDVLQHAEL